MSVDSIAKQIQVEPASARTISTVPDLIQSLRWDAPAYFLPSSAETDPVRSIRFDFYDNQLFKIVATYDRRRIEGMTAEDLIDSISTVYGSPDRPDETVAVSAYAGYEDRQKVIARWESGDSVYVLFRSSLGGDFGLVSYSKKLDASAAVSLREAERQDALAAPQREIDRQQAQDEDRRIREAESRSANKPNFRP
jgi:hypothetical protein